MQNVQRHFGKYMKRTADDQQVSILLKEFEDADQLLLRIIESSKAWREAWISILTFQARLFGEFEVLYAPILGASDDYQGHAPVETPDHLVSRTSRIKTECDDLKKDLKDVLDQVEFMMIRPAQDARDNLQSLKRRTIKKREDKKLDYERYQNRVETSMKKTKRSERDNLALAKAEKELESSTEQYRAADEHLRHILPPLLQAVYSLQPPLLAAQIQIQNSLLGHYYTSLYTYCSQEGFPNPSPPADEIIRLWDDALLPVKKEAEAITILATGKSVRLGLQQNGQSQTNGVRRPSHTSGNLGRQNSTSPARQIAPGPSTSTPLLLADVPSRPKIASRHSSSLLSPHPQASHSPQEQALVISPSPSHSVYATPLAFVSPSPNQSTDYFSRGRQPSSNISSNNNNNNNSNNHHTTTTNNNYSASPSSSSHSNGTTTMTTTTNKRTTSTSISPGPSSALVTLATGKKKPPPPPPPRKPTTDQFHFVTALYDFDGQNDGDLIFREGDKIRVIKKSESTDDWWQGELRGLRGMFPANYCQ